MLPAWNAMQPQSWRLVARQFPVHRLACDTSVASVHHNLNGAGTQCSESEPYDMRNCKAVTVNVNEWRIGIQTVLGLLES